jgi:hypothetical protein
VAPSSARVHASRRFAARLHVVCAESQAGDQLTAPSDRWATIARCMRSSAANGRGWGTERPPPARSQRRRKRRGGKASRARRRLRRRPVIEAPRKRAQPEEFVMVVEPFRRKPKKGRPHESRGERTVQCCSKRRLASLRLYLEKRRAVGGWVRLPPWLLTDVRLVRRASQVHLSPRPHDSPNPPAFWPWPVCRPDMLGRAGPARTEGDPELQWRKCRTCGSHYQGSRKGDCGRHSQRAKKRK